MIWRFCIPIVPVLALSLGLVGMVGAEENATSIATKRAMAQAVRRAMAQATSPALPSQVKELFRRRCFECHGGTKTNAGIKILDRESLVAAKKVVAPGKAEESTLFQLVTAQDDSIMPPAGHPPLSGAEVEIVRKWINSGATDFPPDIVAASEQQPDKGLIDLIGPDYELKRILEHVRTVAQKDRRFMRYFSTHHLLTGGATRDELDVHADALAKAINHLSYERKLVRPAVINEPIRTMFAVDIRELGWHKQPFEIQDLAGVRKSSFNLYDLAILEYPYGVFYEDSESYELLFDEYLTPAGLVEPVPYLRADWFVSIVTQPPLYEDFLQLPNQLSALETQLGVDTAKDSQDGRAKRAGMTFSGISRNNRVVERHPISAGAYWQSFDFISSSGQENIFQDPLHLHPDGGEIVFNLPNGLQGYYLCSGSGRRLPAALTDIVTDKFADNKTVRNGLSCMRCHDAGMKSLVDNMRPSVERLPGSPGFSKRDVLALYPPQSELDDLIREDSERFQNAMQKLTPKPQVTEPLAPVTRRFLESPLQLRSAAAELGLADSSSLQQVFRSPQFASLGLISLASGGVVHRDMWEDYYPHLVSSLGLGVPLVPLDGLTRRDFPPSAAPFEVELTSSKKNNFFVAGEEVNILVKNRSKLDLFIELIGTSASGDRVILATSKTTVKAGEEFRFPEKGSLKVQPGLGKEQITLFASDKEFAGGQLLRGKNISDRVIHEFYKLQRKDNELNIGFDANRMIKRTLDIETK